MLNHVFSGFHHFSHEMSVSSGGLPNLAAIHQAIQNDFSHLESSPRPLNIVSASSQSVAEVKIVVEATLTHIIQALDAPPPVDSKSKAAVSSMDHKSKRFHAEEVKVDREALISDLRIMVLVIKNTLLSELAVVMPNGLTDFVGHLFQAFDAKYGEVPQLWSLDHHVSEPSYLVSASSLGNEPQLDKFKLPDASWGIAESVIPGIDELVSGGPEMVADRRNTQRDHFEPKEKLIEKLQEFERALTYDKRFRDKMLAADKALAHEYAPVDAFASIGQSGVADGGCFTGKKIILYGASEDGKETSQTITISHSEKLPDDTYMLTAGTKTYRLSAGGIEFWKGTSARGEWCLLEARLVAIQHQSPEQPHFRFLRNDGTLRQAAVRVMLESFDNLWILSGIVNVTKNNIDPLLWVLREPRLGVGFFEHIYSKITAPDAAPVGSMVVSTAFEDQLAEFQAPDPSGSAPASSSSKTATEKETKFLSWLRKSLVDQQYLFEFFKTKATLLKEVESYLDITQPASAKSSVAKSSYTFERLKALYQITAENIEQLTVAPLSKLLTDPALDLSGHHIRWKTGEGEVANCQRDLASGMLTISVNVRPTSRQIIPLNLESKDGLSPGAYVKFKGPEFFLGRVTRVEPQVEGTFFHLDPKQKGSESLSAFFIAKDGKVFAHYRDQRPPVAVLDDELHFGNPTVEFRVNRGLCKMLYNGREASIDSSALFVSNSLDRADPTVQAFSKTLERVGEIFGSVEEQYRALRAEDGLSHFPPDRTPNGSLHLASELERQSSLMDAVSMQDIDDLLSTSLAVDTPAAFTQYVLQSGEKEKMLATITCLNQMPADSIATDLLADPLKLFFTFSADDRTSILAELKRLVDFA